MLKAVISEQKLDQDAEKVAYRKGIPKELSKMVLEAMLEDRQENKRQPKAPAPEGGISLRSASRKYEVQAPTLCRWVQKGYIPILLRTKNELYIDEAKLIKIVKYYKSSPGQGKFTIRQALEVK